MAEVLCVRIHVCAGVCQSPGVTIRLCVCQGLWFIQGVAETECG